MKIVLFNINFTEIYSYSKAPFYNKPTLVQIMVWHWTNGKSLLEPMMA